jgi:hypothetical protein
MEYVVTLQLVSVDFEETYGFLHRNKMCHTTKSYGIVVHILNLITKDYYGFFYNGNNVQSGTTISFINTVDKATCCS